MADPFKITGPAVISFSGGRTSGLMLYRILEAHGGTLPDDVKVVFCNTGKEREETLEFVERCSQRWGVPVVWLEYRYEAPVPCPTRDADWPLLDDELDGERARRWDRWQDAMVPIRSAHAAAVRAEVDRRKAIPKAQRKGLPRVSRVPGRHAVAVVDFATASRCGEPLEEVIGARNMLPNVVARFCTVECKIRTTNRFTLALGWPPGWANCIGFRADEPQRVAKLRSTNRHQRENPLVPVAKAGVTQTDVRAFWAAHPFDLELQPHEGNCDLCFLKGIGKTSTVLRARPALAKWWVRMEAAADRRGLARNPTVAFFRKDRPRYAALLELSKRPGLFDDVEAADELSISCTCSD